MEQQPKIADRCPSCGHQSLFIGEGGWITCGNLSTCKEPGLTHYLRALRERDEKRMERDQAFIQAAIRYFHLMSEGHDPALLVVDWEKLDSPPTVLDLALAAYRARREERKGK